MSILDWFDDYIAGPFNLIDRLEGLIRGAIYGDLGYQISILYHDCGGSHTRREIEVLLKRYGVAVYGRTHDAKHMHFRVKKRQARWAEYILLHANAKITSSLVDGRNPGYVAYHEPG